MNVMMAVLAASVVALATGTEGAPPAAPSRLPDFELTTLDGGATRTAAAVPGQGKWLIVYVQPNCAPCDALLGLIKRDEHPDLPARMVIIDGGASAVSAGEARRQFAELSDARWYADTTGVGWTALDMSGAPMVFGMNDGMIQWRLSGMNPPKADVKSILASWVRE